MDCIDRCLHLIDVANATQSGIFNIYAVGKDVYEDAVRR